MLFVETDFLEYEVTEQAREMLSKIKGPISVVTTAGKYRTGKSYLINKLMKKPNAFRVSATTKSCTKGIWVYNKAI